VLTGVGFLIGQRVSGSARPAAETRVLAMAFIAVVPGLIALVAIPSAFCRGVARQLARASR
jgi:hypothetical protein